MCFGDFAIRNMEEVLVEFDRRSQQFQELDVGRNKLTQACSSVHRLGTSSDRLLGYFISVERSCEQVTEK